MPNTSTQLERGARFHPGRLFLADFKSAEREAKTHETELKKLADKERHSLARIQQEVYKTRHQWSKSVGVPLSLLGVNTSVEDMLQQLATEDNSKNEKKVTTTTNMRMVYGSNNSAKQMLPKNQLLNNAHKQLLKKLKSSQKLFQNTRPEDSLKTVTCQPLSSLCPRQDYHACRGVSSTHMYRLDCRQCAQMVNNKIKTLAKSQESKLSAAPVQLLPKTNSKALTHQVYSSPVMSYNNTDSYRVTSVNNDSSQQLTAVKRHLHRHPIASANGNNLKQKGSKAYFVSNNELFQDKNELTADTSITKSRYRREKCVNESSERITIQMKLAQLANDVKKIQSAPTLSTSHTKRVTLSQYKDVDNYKSNTSYNPFSASSTVQQHSLKSVTPQPFAAGVTPQQLTTSVTEKHHATGAMRQPFPAGVTQQHHVRGVTQQHRATGVLQTSRPWQRRKNLMEKAKREERAVNIKVEKFLSQIKGLSQKTRKDKIDTNEET